MEYNYYVNLINYTNAIVWFISNTKYFDRSMYLNFIKS